MRPQRTVVRGNEGAVYILLDNQGEDEVRMAREAAGHSDGRSDVLRGGGGLGKASYINGATPEIDAAASIVVYKSVVTAD
ncbi:hypothetical protein PUN28_017231 [Cardiocondyla obscurior]|uniref:Uncharacterized protein n=1 Tax=Cardiocondyla obscurior TaxID=286306 RepID=A0AAW2EN77_9HYME